MKRYVILYVITLGVLIPLDFMFLGVIAKPFFKAPVGDMRHTISFEFLIVNDDAQAVGQSKTEAAQVFHRTDGVKADSARRVRVHEIGVDRRNRHRSS